MAKQAKAVPDGYYTLTPHLTIKGCAAAMEFYQRAFGAEDLGRMQGPDGRIMHAEMRIGNSRFMLGEEFPEMGALSPQTLGGSPQSLMIYTENVDAAWKRAVDAGATVKMPLADMFWGDRYGKLTDPYGHNWALGQHLEDVSPEEMQKRARAAMAAMGKPS